MRCRTGLRCSSCSGAPTLEAVFCSTPTSSPLDGIEDSDIFLDDISVSRRHATFGRTPDGTVVKDVGSLNGTYVNRDLVDESLLRSGDEVQIGKFRLVYYGSARAAE